MLFRSIIAWCLITTSFGIDIIGVLQVPSKSLIVIISKCYSADNKLESIIGHPDGLEYIFSTSRVILEDGREYAANVDQRGIFRM